MELELVENGTKRNHYNWMMLNSTSAGAVAAGRTDALMTSFTSSVTSSVEETNSVIIAAIRQLVLKYIYIVMGSCGTLGNFLVVIVIIGYTKMSQKVSNLFYCIANAAPFCLKRSLRYDSEPCLQIAVR
jgi:hypothetical protein